MRFPVRGGRVVLRGRLTLDGSKLDARWLGAVVLSKDGLVTPCQLALSSVRRGRGSIDVMANAEASGCGVPGAEIALWTFAHDKIIFSRDTWRWPRNRGLRVDASFSSATPNGSVPPRAEFAGGVFRPDGSELPGGTRIDAYVGATRCGVTSVRRTGSFSGFILAVVGPDSVPGCTRGSTITFRVNGRPALDTAVNEPGRSGTLDLTVPLRAGESRAPRGRRSLRPPSRGRCSLNSAKRIASGGVVSHALDQCRDVGRQHVGLGERDAIDGRHDDRR